MNDHTLAEHAHPEELTHAGALGMTLLAYWFARTRAGSRRFTSAAIHGCPQGHAAPVAAASAS